MCQCHVDRRLFLSAGGVLLSGLAAGQTFGQQSVAYDPEKDFLSCIDLPVRKPGISTDKKDPVKQANYLNPNVHELPPASPIPRGAPIPASAPIVARAQQSYMDAPRSREQIRKDEPARGPARAAYLNYWQKSTLSVGFLGGSRSLQDRVLDIASKWSNHATIDFVRASNPYGADIRCGFITDQSNPSFGHWSYVGTQAIGITGATMNLAVTESSLDSNRYHHGVVLHEFGHAIGQVHEHLSPGDGGIVFDPDATFDYFERVYGWGRKLTLENVLNKYNTDSLIRFSQFDPDSIMLYAFPGSITTDGRGTKQNNDLSDTDIEFVQQLYPPGRNGTRPTNPPPGTNPETTTVTSSQPVSLELNKTSKSYRVGPATVPIRTFTFNVSDPGEYKIATTGVTQVIFEVLDASGSEVKGSTYTPDLVNQITKAKLAAGTHKIRLSHRVPGGGGSFQITVSQP